jgi:hypothetical protein
VPHAYLMLLDLITLIVFGKEQKLMNLLIKQFFPASTAYVFRIM